MGDKHRTKPMRCDPDDIEWLRDNAEDLGCVQGRRTPLWVLLKNLIQEYERLSDQQQAGISSKGDD